MPKGHVLKRFLSQALMRAWTHRGLLALLLLPVSLVYYGLVRLHRFLYQVEWLKSRSVNCAVIVVGNAIVGGAGKTPTTIGLVRHLRARGLTVGVVSRGHGRSGQGVQAVNLSADAAEVGDEPLLIARATGAPVFVAASRWQAASALLVAYPQTQVIVCDDGLQHYALQRDIEVCVFDDRGTGNGWLLPSGMLREPWPRTPIASVGQSDDRLLVLHTGRQPAFAGFRAHRVLAKQAIAADATAVDLRSLKPPLLALAGVAQPQAFFSALRAEGLVLEKTLALPDHFDFAHIDPTLLQGYAVLCTDKDAVKLWKQFPAARAVALVQTLEPAFLAALDNMLDAVLATKLSSSHGHQTA